MPELIAWGAVEKSMSHLILRGAALQRCDIRIFSRVSAAGVKMQVALGLFRKLCSHAFPQRARNQSLSVTC